MEHRVLITGSEGFIGKHLVARLEKEGISYNAPRLTELDITDREKVQTLNGFSIIYHFAALTRAEKKGMVAMNQTNVLGTKNLLELATRTKSTFVFLSTAAVYGLPQYSPIDEQHPLNPLNSYAESKRDGEDLCRKFATEHNFRLYILRLPQVIGEGQERGFVVPDILEQIKNGRVSVRNLHSKRDFLDIQDLMDLLVRLVDGKTVPPETYNIGSGTTSSVQDILSICSKYRKFETISEERYDQPKEIKIDTDKIRKLSGWRPSRTLSDTIGRMFATSDS